jgi:transcriptional regulator with XRE-family HTH domain
VSPNPDAGTSAAAAFVARRTRLGLSQEKIRDRTGLSVSSLIDFEKSRSWPRERTKAKLEHIVGWPPGTLDAIRAGKPAPGETAGADPSTMIVLDGLRHVETLALTAIQIADDPVGAAARLAAIRDLIRTLTPPTKP